VGYRSIFVLPNEKPLPSVLKNPKGNLSQVMRHIDGLYTQRFNRHHGLKTRMERKKKFRDRIEDIAAEIYQEKI